MYIIRFSIFKRPMKSNFYQHKMTSYYYIFFYGEKISRSYLSAKAQMAGYTKTEHPKHHALRIVTYKHVKQQNQWQVEVGQMHAPLPYPFLVILGEDLNSKKMNISSSPDTFLKRADVASLNLSLMTSVIAVQALLGKKE